jgi:hypothetical protein
VKFASLIGFLAMQAFGQRGMPPTGPGSPGGGFGVPTVGVGQRGVPTVGATRPPNPGGRFSRSSAFVPSGFPLYFGGSDYGYPPPSNVIIVEQTPPQTIVQPAPVENVQAVIHEYQPGAPVPPAAVEEQPAFAIVLKDGSVLSAAAVSVKDDVLHYVDPDGQHGRLLLNSIDRQATQKENRQRNLELRIPVK